MATYGVMPYQQAKPQLLPGESVAPNGNPIYNGAYNPMYHQAQGQPITLKDLASLYYKSTGAGVIGDNPNPYHAANVYRNELAVKGNVADWFGGQDYLPKSPEDVRKMLQARIDLAGGNREQVFNQLVDQVNQAKTAQTAQKAGYTPAQSKAIAAEQAAKGGGGGSPLQSDVMNAWFQQYISPYIQEQQAMKGMYADTFDNIVSQILPTMSGPQQQIMQTYAPLISQYYHDQANNYATNFLLGNDQGSLMYQLLKGGKKNSAIVNYLKQQQDTSGVGAKGANIFAQLGINGLG